MQLTNQEIEVAIDHHLEQLSKLYDPEAAAALPAQQAENPELKRFENAIASARSDKLSKKYEHSFLNIAEAYEYAAMINSRPAANGQTLWDIAWSVLNREALQAVLAVSRTQKDVLTNNYADLLFARGVHCLREMKYGADAEVQNASAQTAIVMFYSYLLQTRKFKLEHWQIHDAIKNIRIATRYGAVTDEQLQALTAKILARPGEQDSVALLEQVKQTVAADTLPLPTDRTQLQQTIY